MQLFFFFLNIQYVLIGCGFVTLLMETFASRLVWIWCKIPVQEYTSPQSENVGESLESGPAL